MAPVRKVQKWRGKDGGVVTTLRGGAELLVYLPVSEMCADLINYGFTAPTLLVFPDEALSPGEAAAFADRRGLAGIAAENGGSVLFVNPGKDGWEKEGPGLYEQAVSMLRLSQWDFSDGVVYDDKVPKNHFERERRKAHPLEDPVPEYFVLGSTVAVYVFAFGRGADYVAARYLRDIKAPTYFGDLGEGDATMTSAYLEGLTEKPEILSPEIGIVSAGNPPAADAVFRSACRRFTALPEVPEDLTAVYDEAIGDWRRWKGRVMRTANLRKERIAVEPLRFTVPVSPDNHGERVSGPVHEVGVVVFHGADTPVTDPARPLPLLFCFHGGGDTAMATALIGGWPEIARDEGFLLAAVEMHLSVPAAETMEILRLLEERYAIDASRIYATGFSMGGIKTWDLYQEYPEAFAGLMPMGATVEVGENAQFAKAPRVNDSVPVPVFYNGGESSPLAELPFHEPKCVHRIANLFAVNRLKTPYPCTWENKDTWAEPVYGIRGDREETMTDPDYPDSVYTIRFFAGENGEEYTALCSVSSHSHEIRPATCRRAWAFIRRFRRTADGGIAIDSN